MVKVIIHCADIHIRNYRLHDEYKEVFDTFLSDVREKTGGYKREEIRIAIVGDLVHQKITISNEQLLLTAWFIKELEKIAPVILIAGNHDLLENNKDRMDSITPIVQFLGDKNINYFKQSGCYLDDNIVWCVYSIFDENKRPNIEGARAEFGDDKTYVGLFHAPIVNAKTDIGYQIDHGASLDIFNGCCFVLLGDIHMRQNFNHNGIQIAYSSSLLQQNFGESISKHGYLLWNVETKNYTEHDIENNNSFYQFKITSLDDLDTNNEKLINV